VQVDALARVEGEGAMRVEIHGDEVVDVELRIYEPPRFFEALLRGRQYTEPPDITARICGICPVAYQMSACNAIEDACGVAVDEPIQQLRRLVYCGEWIESHVLHVYMLHAPDFLGFDGAIAMAEADRGIVERGLQLKKVGNRIIELVGGRAIHPVNVRVGGFYRAPERRALRALRDPLLRARDAAVETVRWVAGFDFPDFEQDYEFVALHHPDEYPITRGRVASTGGLDLPVAGFEDAIEEVQQPHSNALHARLRGAGSYFVGPMARYNLCADRLSPLAQEEAAGAGLGDRCANPFRSIVVRSVEVLYACDEALRIVEAYEEPDRPAVPVEPVAGTGYGASEAPRGLLYHRYVLGGDGSIAACTIVPPTSQNQATIEHDLRHFVAAHLDLTDDALRLRCEQAIRNYDPCISCATHFLDLTVQRT
jgi:coenzyme F420-reducing hydrogenase alpha subunit